MKWWINDCEYWKVISLNCGERRGYESELRSNEHCLCSSVLNCSVHYLSSGEHYCLRYSLHRSIVLVAVVDTKNLDVGKSKLIHEQAIGKRTVDIGWNQPLILNHLFLPEPTWTRTPYILEMAFDICKLTEYWLFAPLKSVGYWHADLWCQNFPDLECLCFAYTETDNVLNEQSSTRGIRIRQHVIFIAKNTVTRSNVMSTGQSSRVFQGLKELKDLHQPSLSSMKSAMETITQNKTCRKRKRDEMSDSY